MISRVAGRLLTRDLDRVEVMTAGGVAYEISIPRSAFERLPPVGKEIELRTHQIVREDDISLYGFLDESDRIVFARLLLAQGVGPRLALALLSALPAPRLVRAIRERDIAILTAVSGVGKKTAERLSLDLANRFDDVPLTGDVRAGRPDVDDALRALAVLGFAPADAERAVRQAVKDNGASGAQELIRAALGYLK